MTAASRLIAMVFATLLASCDYPRDSADTFQNVRGGTLRVGVSERPPWVVERDGEPAGVEPRLIEAFADKLGAKVAWTWGTESSLAAALKERQLDVFFGEVFIVPRAPAALSGADLVRRVSEVRKSAKNFNWRIRDLTIMPVDRDMLDRPSR